MARAQVAVLAVLSIGACATRVRLRGPTDVVDMKALKSQVFASRVFEDKVAQLCKGATEDCAERTSDMLFCQLLKRSGSAAAGEQCAGGAAAIAAADAAPASALPSAVPPPVMTGKLATVKAKILASEGFKRELKHMAGVLGCDGMKKEAACVSYVEEVAFCFAFAEKMTQLSNVTGASEEATYCKKIDEKVPKLSMLLQQWKHARPVLAQVADRLERKLAAAPEDDLAQEMTHDLEMNFNKIAPFGKEDTAKELQDHAAKTQDTLVDAVENAEVAEIKRAVFRALTRLRAATIKEFDTIARLETQAIDAYNDAHHYRAENPLAHLHEDEAPVETDKLKSFH